MEKRTIIYVDGFNLYYGSLRKSPYKWLDLRSLFQKILGKRHSIIEIKYFTARITPFNDVDRSPERQKIYLNALQHYIQNLKIYFGYYLTNRIKARVCNPMKVGTEYIEVYKTEEKGSDVNLALHILNDAWLNKYDCAVLVSNDSDIAESLRFIKQEHNKQIGLIVPGSPKTRKVSNELKKYADFIGRIREGVLADSQLPNPIPETNFYKPKEWKI